MAENVAEAGTGGDCKDRPAVPLTDGNNSEKPIKYPSKVSFRHLRSILASFSNTAGSFAAVSTSYLRWSSERASLSTR